jgi:hypothetical protein
LLLKRMMVAWVRTVREDLWDAAVSQEKNSGAENNGNNRILVVYYDLMQYYLR